MLFKFYVSSILMSILLIGCSSPPGSQAMGIAKSTEQLAQEKLQAEAKASFNAQDLSGCWQEIEVFPGNGGPGEGFLLRKIADNQYQGSGQYHDKEILTVKDKAVELKRQDGSLKKGETAFETLPENYDQRYLIIFEPETGVEWESPSKRGWKWYGKTCS